MSVEGGFVRWLNPKDGSVIRSGWATGARGVWTGLARSRQGLLLGISGYFHPTHGEPFGIYRIDPITASPSLIVQTSLFGLTAISFGPNDELFALRDPSYGQPGGISELLTIDLVTGSHTVIGSTGLTLSGTLAYGEGSLWAYNFDVGLARIDPATGAATDVNPGFRGPMDLGQSLTFSDEGALYLVDYGVWVMDTATGVPVFAGFIAGLPIISCAEFIPNQPEPFSLGLRGETGSPMGVFVAGATPGGTVAVLHGYGFGGPTSIPAGLPCAGSFVDLAAPVKQVLTLTAGPGGKADFGPVYVPPQVQGRVRLQALDLASCRTSNVARVIY